MNAPHSWDSSDPSPQSLSWSHTKCFGIHSLFWHMNSPALHVLLNTEQRRETIIHTNMFSRRDFQSICTEASDVFDHSPQPAFTLSSAPSGQSLSPSHTQRCGTHLCESGHWNASALHVLFSESKTHMIYRHIKQFLESFNVIYYVKAPLLCFLRYYLPCRV